MDTILSKKYILIYGLVRRMYQPNLLVASLLVIIIISAVVILVGVQQDGAGCFKFGYTDHHHHNHRPVDTV